MIFSQVISFFVAVVNAMLNLLPHVSIATIPVIGETVRGYLVTMVETWNAFLITFPYADIVWTLFLAVVLPFEITLLIARIVLGHRAPISHDA